MPVLWRKEMEQEGLNGIQVGGQGRGGSMWLNLVAFENAVYKPITLVSY